MSYEIQRNSKTLIFCFDGTCNDPDDSMNFSHDGSISNIVKMHILLGGDFQGKSCFSQQKSFYYSGVGTLKKGRFATISEKISQKFRASVFAHLDIKKIIDSASKQLVENYQIGDRICIFGFSRGAATARIFASKIREYCPEATIEFIGVFDTVAAIKGSLDLKENTYPASGILFENGTLGEHIRRAVHLVSLDERRLAFQPTLLNKNKRVKEVWLPGVHSDVGGGFWFDGLSDIALDLMVREAKLEGLKFLSVHDIDFKKINVDSSLSICLDDLEINPLCHGKLHSLSRLGGIAKKTLRDRKVRVNENDRPSEELPIIHESVLERFRFVAGYRPSALRNLKYRVIKKNGELESFSRFGINGLRISQESDLPPKNLTACEIERSPLL